MKLLMLFLLLLHNVSHACLWDRDTLAAEAKGNMDVVHTAVGWFDRNPPLYYSMRLERVQKQIEAGTDDLSLYDDAAVAADRMGKSDLAIDLMSQKLAKMKNLRESKQKMEHLYRYHANLGTFYVHRWIHMEPIMRGIDMRDLSKGENEIRKALKINPAAHFGRERVQLDVIQWLQSDIDPKKFNYGFPGFFAQSRSHSERSAKIKGLCGLVQLGAAWQSADVFRGIGEGERLIENASLSIMAFLRAHQLQTKSFSIHPDLEGRSAAKSQKPFIELANDMLLMRENLEYIVPFFNEARKASDQRHRARTAFMLAMLKQGKHPDTDRLFWSDWKEPKFPKFPPQLQKTKRR